MIRASFVLLTSNSILMDLTLKVKESTLNIRVAVLLRIDGAYVFEQKPATHAHAHAYAVGGRMKINESSRETARRELEEELGVQTEVMELRAIIENFFVIMGETVHEICFVYDAGELSDFTIPEGFICVKPDLIPSTYILPIVMKDIIQGKQEGIQHFIVGK